MRYRLKSNAAIVAEGWLDDNCCWYQMPGNSNRWFMPTELFNQLWEPVPADPPKPKLIEERCRYYAKELMKASSHYDSESTALLASNLDEAADRIKALEAVAKRAADEIHLLRKEVAFLTADRDDRDKHNCELLAEIERLRAEVASITADRDERAKQKGEFFEEIERLRKDYAGMVECANWWMNQSKHPALRTK
jgi:hypothetical protein